jgi:hypothetical protein
MSISLRPPAHNVGRLTAFILCLIVFVCISMIGATEYLKFNMDRAESLLAAPDAAVGSDQDLFDRLRRILGYGGFLGLAQNYASHHDVSGFAEMKADIKSADEIVAHLPEKTPAEIRHDLVAIVSSFDTALAKLNAPANEGDFTAADLVPLYAALPVLDARVASANAETRLAAQGKTQYWGMLLTLMCWGSLISAAFCAAWTYLTLRDKHSAPMRALAQSIQNMARGDMRTAIWGIERQDMIGELARAVDIARYHFSHLPDLSLLSEQGPVRMRFEGGSRSLFEAMMKAITRDSENIREQTQALTAAVQEQKETIGQMADKVEHVLQNIAVHGQDGDQQIRQAISDMVGSAEGLKNAHAHAADQLSRLVPHLQDRAAGMAEIANITGKQVAQTLQSLTLSEMNLKANADNARETLNRLSSTADDLGERLFGAINLLQASGKVLAETTENMQGRGPAPSHGELLAPIVTTETFAPLAARLEEIAAQLNDVQSKMAEQFDIQMALSSTQHTMPSDASASGQFAFESALAQIQTKLEQLGDTMSMARPTPDSSATPNTQSDLALLSGFEQLLAERVESKLVWLGQNFEQNSAVVQATGASTSETQAKLAELSQTITDQVQKKFDAVVTSMGDQARGIIDAGNSSALETRESITNLGERILTLAAVIPAERQNMQSEEHRLSTQIEALKAGIESHSNEAVLTAIREIAASASALPQTLQHNLQQDWQRLSGQIAEQLQTKFDALATGMGDQARGIIDANNSSSLQTREFVSNLGEKLLTLTAAIPAELRQNMQIEEQRLSLQIETMKMGIESQSHEPVLAAIREIASLASALPQSVRQDLQEDWQRLQGQVDALQSEIEQRDEQQKQEILNHNTLLALQTRDSLINMGEKFDIAFISVPDSVRQSLHQDLHSLSESVENLHGTQQAIGQKLAPNLAAIEQAIQQQTSHILVSMTDASADAHNQLAVLGGKIVELAEALPSEVQERLEKKLAPNLAAIAQAIQQQTSHILVSLTDASADAHNQLAGLGGKIVELAEALPSEVQERLEKKLAPNLAAIEQTIQQQTSQILVGMSDTSADAHNQLAVLGGKIDELSQALPSEVQERLQKNWNDVTAQIDSVRTGFENVVAHKLLPDLALARNIAGHTSAASEQALSQLTAMEAKLSELSHALPQTMHAELVAAEGHLISYIDQATSQIGVTVAGQIDPRMTAIDAGLQELQAIASATQQGVDATKSIADANYQELTKAPEPRTYLLPPELQQQMRDHWYQIAAQIEASRSSVDRMFTEQVAGKLESFEQALATTRKMVDTVREEVARPAKNVFSLPPELQQQMHDQWRQIAAQIEASRANMVDTIAHQVEMMESRLNGKGASTLSRTASDYATQRQIEQQTQILSELVATLGVLDTHMQQIKVDMHQQAHN